MGFRQCLPLSLTTLRDEHYRHAIAAMGVWSTGSSRLMQISLLSFFKTITKIWLKCDFMGYLSCYCVHKIKILLMRFLANANFFPVPKVA